ncbi:hypothetical protein BDA99DRAFT_512018 [Phascolomyces articulosus]|uniref:Homeobox domain-containing protein n=1 Tax=Phascolomyces articulosus TaxID=60185 RepID=A0AAD5PDR6_9FUNG|nr:hypothetical protein BDA99DRAFT_512018 [Phascolomyces articulosus]
MVIPLRQRRKSTPSLQQDIIQTTITNSRKRTHDSLDDDAWAPSTLEETMTEDDDEEEESSNGISTPTSSFSDPGRPIKKQRKRHSTLNHRRRRRSLSTTSNSSTQDGSKKTRKNYSRETTRILMNWYLKHGGKTPEPKHKDELAKKANKSHVQISTWFQNARRRHHPKLVQYQKLTKEYPNQVYDYDSFVAFNNKKSSTTTKKHSTFIDTEEEEDEDDDEEEGDDEDY